MKKTIAVFDFDKTITDRHTFWRFMRYCAGNAKFYFSLVVLTPKIIKVLRKKCTLMQLREASICRIFKGMEFDKYQTYCQNFTLSHINNWISEEAVEQIKWHREQGHTLILLSNSLEEYLKIWANQFSFQMIIGSQLQFVNQKATGQLTGNHCFGPEKVTRLKEVIGDPENYTMYAYGDSEADKYVLEVATKPYFRHFNLKKKYDKRHLTRA